MDSVGYNSTDLSLESSRIWRNFITPAASKIYTVDQKATLRLLEGFVEHIRIWIPTNICKPMASQVHAVLVLVVKNFICCLILSRANVTVRRRWGRPHSFSSCLRLRIQSGKAPEKFGLLAINLQQRRQDGPESHCLRVQLTEDDCLWSFINLSNES